LSGSTLRVRAWLLVLSVALTACGGGAPSPAATTLEAASLTPAPQPTVTPAPPTLAPTATAATAGIAVDVPGTHITMTPPEGFVASRSFVGFEHECGASIVVSELPTGYPDLVDELSDDRMVAQGFTDVIRSAEEVDGRPATFIIAKQRAAGLLVMKILVLTGTDSITAFLTGNHILSTCPLELGEAMRDAELGMSFDPDRPIDAEGALRFTLSPVAPLRFAGALNNGALYNTSGKVPSPDPSEPSLIVSPSLGGGAGDDVIAFAIAQLDSMTSIRDVAIESSEEATIAGRPAAIVIATATGTTRDDDIVVYSVLLGGEGDYVSFLGICEPADRAEFFEKFDASIRTYAPKP
jgi:hypothetical protein